MCSSFFGIFSVQTRKKKEKKKKEKRKKKEKEIEEKRKIQLSLLPFHLSPVFPSLNSSFAFLLLLPNQIQKEKRTPFLSGSVNVGISMFFRYIFSQHPPLLHSKKMFYVLFLVMRRSQKPGGTTLVRVFQKNSPLWGSCSFFVSFSLLLFPNVQCSHIQSRSTVSLESTSLLYWKGLGHCRSWSLQQQQGSCSEGLVPFFRIKEEPNNPNNTKKTRLEQTPVQSRLFQLGPPVQPSSPEPRK